MIGHFGRLSLSVAFALTACSSGGLEVADAGSPLDGAVSPPTPPGTSAEAGALDLAGRWASACTVNPDGSSAMVHVVLDATTWDLDYDVYTDGTCTAWGATVSIAGPYQVQGPSSVVSGAYEARFGFTSKVLTPRAAALATALSQDAACAAQGSLQVGVGTSIIEAGCPTFGQYPKGRCDADNDLVAVSADGVLHFGARPADNDLCTTERRPTALGALALRKEEVPFSQELGSLPPGAFLENLAVDPTGAIYVTSLNDRSIYKYAKDSGFQPYVTGLPAGPVGIVRNDDGGLYVTTTAPASIVRIAPDKTVTTVATVQEAGLLNGMQRLQPGVILISDSRALRVWRFDEATGTVSVWKTDPALERAPGGPQGGLGPNGLQIRDRVVYVANPIRRTLVRIPVLADGAAGAVQVQDVGVAIDDFAVRADGVIFATSHDRALYRIGSDGKVSTVATEADGIHGCTAAQFGRTPADRDFLYVVGDGGFFWSQTDQRTVEPAKLVRLDVRARE